VRAAAQACALFQQGRPADCCGIWAAEKRDRRRVHRAFQHAYQLAERVKTLTEFLTVQRRERANHHRREGSVPRTRWNQGDATA
jgi:hypothetical protein